jgi:hypothetical protein
MAEPKPGRIAAQWEAFAKEVLPPDVWPIQTQEMRRAFYAGVVALQNIMLTQVSPGDDVTPADEALMRELDAEVSAFFDDVQAGRA